ncbi:MAG: hypothetical protein ACI4WY_09545 [Anaerovoracaceae bacterium]
MPTEQKTSEKGRKKKERKSKLGMVTALCLIPVALVLCILVYAKTDSLLLTLLVAIVMSAAEVVLILYSYLSQMNDQ